LFGALAQQHKKDSAELHNVRRVTDAEQRRAFNLMHKGDFRPALEIFDNRGAITWTQTDDEARAALVQKYAKDLTAEPEKTRFVFANSNAERRALNSDIRALHRERGELGKDHVLQAAEGAEAFARGDRIQFTGNGWGKQQREAGFTNGSVGTIRAIEGDRLTVALDAKKGQPERVLSFTVGEDAKAGEFNKFRHGYAGTIYQGQGKTLDQTYVLHSSSMGAAASYVGLSRHRDEVALFTTRGADAWMKATGGAEGLTKEQHKSAEASYARWAEAKPELAAKHDFADYVGYVQEQWKGREPDRSADLDRMAKQMGRIDDRRSASQFHHDGAALDREQEKPKGRYAVLVRLGHYLAEKAAGVGGAGEGTGQQADRPTGPTGQERGEAQGVAARIGAMRDPRRQANALRAQHGADRMTGTQEPAPKVQPQPSDRAMSEIAAMHAETARRDTARAEPEPKQPEVPEQGQKPALSPRDAALAEIAAMHAKAAPQGGNPAEPEPKRPGTQEPAPKVQPQPSDRAMSEIAAMHAETTRRDADRAKDAESGRSRWRGPSR
jgi:hypothetical protein